MSFHLTINTDSSAFDDNNCGNEIARILREVAGRMEEDCAVVRGVIRDINGNRCGEYTNFGE